MKVVDSICCHDCGGACPLSIYVEGQKIVKIDARDVGYPSLRPCSRGLLYHYRVHSPDRLKYPMKRTGERGEDKFVRISWDDALNEIAAKLTRINETYGPSSILNLSWSGAEGRIHQAATLTRFLNFIGGQTRMWGGASFQGGFFASLATYGRLDTGNERADLLNSKMIILWGSNPAESIFGTETRWYLMRAKEKGIKIVVIDPRFTESAATWAAKWIPIRPGTDAAMLIAMCYVIINEGLQDQDFINQCTEGFDQFKEYVIGTEDGTPKTPGWAEEISGVPAAAIANLAREYAASKPAAIIVGFAPGRTSRGEQYHRVSATLSAITGNVGIAGGSTACLDLSWGARPIAGVETPKNYVDMYSDLPTGSNPIEEGQPLHEYAVKGIRSHTADKISPTKMWDAILRGKAGGYPADIKMLYVIGGNAVNQVVDTNRAVEALRSLEFVVVHDQFMTPTAKFADILLPATTWCERNDIKLPWMFGNYAVFAKKAIEPLYECKNDIDIFTELAAIMGIEDYNTKTEEEWLRYATTLHGIDDYEKFKRTGFFKLPTSEPLVAFKQHVQDPERHPFPTPSGKIEIFCQRIADFGRLDELPAIPKYLEGWGGPSDEIAKKYPLQLITTHSRKRIHSQFDNIAWYKDVEPHLIWLNPVDAEKRYISDDDEVDVFNERGRMRIKAKVTQRIMPGVVNIYQGAWYAPDALGVDLGGCANVLTRGEHSPGGAFCSNSALIEVEKVRGG